MFEKTGTLADTINPPDYLPPEYAFNPEEELVGEDLWEAYNIGKNNQDRIRLTEAEQKSTCVFRYFIDTVDKPNERNFENFNAGSYNTLGLTKKDWNNISFAAKQLTVDELKSRVAKAGGRGVYATPIATPDGNVNPENDNREEFNDNEVGTDESAEMAFLRSIRQSIANFDAKEQTLAEIVHAKFDKVYQTVERVASGRSLKQYAFIYGMPGIGKSYTVKKAAKVGATKWRGVGTRPEVVEYHGAVGSNLSALIVFFFKNRKHKIIILDDADGFVKSPNEDVQNILKGLMDPEGFAITTPVTVRNLVNKMYKKDMGIEESTNSFNDKGVQISVDISKLNEGIAQIDIGGLVYNIKVNESEAEELRKYFPPRKLSETDKKAYKILTEALNGNAHNATMSLQEQDAYINSVDLDSISDDSLATAIVRQAQPTEEIPTEVPASFSFQSSMIMISNLNRDDLNDAIQSRCDCIPIYLTRDEFMFRAEEVLNFITVSKTTLTEPELVNWAKKESFAIFKACMNDLKYKNSRINMKIGIPLELRIIASIAGLLLARFDAWCEKNDITDYMTDPTVFKRFEDDQKVYYIKYDLLPYMAGDLNANYAN